jgi:hypothetical protein
MLRENDKGYPQNQEVPTSMVPFTDKELEDRKRLVAMADAIEKEALETALLRESALQKLADLGLTLEEARAVIGI